MAEYVSAGKQEKRRTMPMPSVLSHWGSKSDGLPKPTPANLRKFAETPVARRAINTIKDRIAGMGWQVRPRRGRDLASLPDGEARVQLLTEALESPNPDDSFRSFSEQVLEDIIVGGFGAAEIISTGNEQKPVELWPVDGATIRMRSDWDGQPSSPRYVQMTGKFGADGAVTLNDEDL